MAHGIHLPYTIPNESAGVGSSKKKSFLSAILPQTASGMQIAAQVEPVIEKQLDEPGGKCIHGPFYLRSTCQSESGTGRLVP